MLHRTARSSVANLEKRCIRKPYLDGRTADVLQRCPLRGDPHGLCWRNAWHFGLARWLRLLRSTPSPTPVRHTIVNLLGLWVHSRKQPAALGALGVSQWRRNECVRLHDRDINAARNIEVPGWNVASGSGNPRPLAAKEPMQIRSRHCRSLAIPIGGKSAG